jgi:hypothetical protein
MNEKRQLTRRDFIRGTAYAGMGISLGMARAARTGGWGHVRPASVARPVTPVQFGLLIPGHEQCRWDLLSDCQRFAGFGASS